MDLPRHAQVVVVGGGIVGCSTAYHLARDHGAEVLLLEQGRLTGGTTWHAAGLVGQLRSSAGVTEMLKHSVDLYTRLGAETGLETGWKQTGCLRLARVPERMDEFRAAQARAHAFGMEMELIGPSEVKAMWPLLEVGDLVGASWLPSDGQATPSDIAMSLARGARMHGARLEEGVRVTGFTMAGGRITAVETGRGPVTCETVVNCAGLWAHQVGSLAGVDVPLWPIKHKYVVTEPIDGLGPDLPTLRDPDRRTYFKEEVGGLVFGGYEPDPEPWDAPPPADFSFQLFGDDWDHFAQHMEAALARIPALAETGIKQMINGPESFTPDGNALMGRAEGCSNMVVGAGFNAFGIASGGGAGWALAHWAMEGAPPLDLAALDIARFGPGYADRARVRSETLAACGAHYDLAPQTA